MKAQTAALPTGTVTFFFSDVQDSTGLLQRLTSVYRDVIERHAAIIRNNLDAHGGTEVSTEGDSFFAVFTTATDAVEAAAAIQQQLASEQWPEGGVVAVRIGLHTGLGELGHDNYVGMDVNRAARISAAGHGGQTVVSQPVRLLAPRHSFTELGVHELKGLDEPEQLFQLDVPGLPQTFPPLRTTSTRPNNLPTLAAPIVGRDADQAALAGLIGANRLVTLTGPGGIGKTRLGLEVANAVLGRFELGVFLVDLTPIDDPELLLSAIATATGVQPSDDDGGLAGALSDGPRLLLLDNFEQLADAAPRLASLLAAAAPLKALVTSQVPLRIAGETIMRLEPLAANDEASPAVELFVDRARQADPAFDIAVHRDDVLRLVDVLDGVPLAIELAAARVNVLTPADVLTRLDAGVLQTTRADSPERHRSIAAAVAWSYGLLTKGQQELLQALSVFRGGASLAAIEAVSGRDPLDDLGELVDRSLVETTTGTIGKRFDMLTSVQRYAAAQVPDDAEFARHHIDHFAQLAIDARQALDDAAANRWLAILGDDVDNLRITLDSLLATGDLQRGYAMLGGIWRFFQLTGRLDELDLWLGRFFGADRTAQPTEARTRALMARGAFHYWSNQWQGAADDYDEALAIAEGAGDPELLADALVGVLATRANAYASGTPVGDHREALERLRRIGTETDDPLLLAFADFYEAITAMADGVEDGPPPIQRLERIAQLFLDAGRLMNVAHLRAASCEILIAEGDYDGARRTALDGLDKAEQAGDVFTMSWALFRLAITIIELGDPELGIRIAGAADAARERTGGRLPPPFIPIADALDRARRLLGDTADTLYEGGRELGLFNAMALAKAAAE
jgi:predicted ATPase/class 3 adenylate cyclase